MEFRTNSWVDGKFRRFSRLCNAMSALNALIKDGDVYEALLTYLSVDNIFALDVLLNVFAVNTGFLLVYLLSFSSVIFISCFLKY